MRCCTRTVLSFEQGLMILFIVVIKVFYVSSFDFCRWFFVVSSSAGDCLVWQCPKWLIIFYSLRHPRRPNLVLSTTVATIAVLSATHHLTSEINFLTHFVSHVLICLFLIYLFSTIISPHQCHHHHYYHPAPHHSSIPNSKLSYFSNPTYPP